MQYGICHLSIVPVRIGASSHDEMVTQLLYGDHFKVKEKRKYCSKIQVAFDKFEGWIDNNQYQFITEAYFEQIDTSIEQRINTDFIAHLTCDKKSLSPILLGSRIDASKIISHSFEGNAPIVQQSKSNLIETALLYINAPFLSGGKTPFGIDASGLTQMVYKINGYKLFRETEKQSTQGEPLSFIEESEPGDLAFFDDNEGIINHVGIILKDNYIIHSYGKVRIDRIDHTGIFNTLEKKYSHKLRVIKKIA